MKILLVDVSSVFHRAYSSLSKRMPNATDINGIPTVGTYGFLTSFFKACSEFGPFDSYLFAIDVKGSTNSRKTTDSEYKGLRTKKSENFYLDLDNLIVNILPQLDILPLGLKNYEADDIIASACNYISRNIPEHNVYIMSGDKDLEQCVVYSPNINFIKTQPKWEYKSNLDILNKWQVSPKDIPLIMSIIGDNSDNIPGIRGYKLKKALQVYNNQEFLDQNREVIEHNLSLIKLKDTLEAVPRPILELTYLKLINCFNELNAKTLINRAPKIFKSLI